jgi:hypothetical protein
VTNADAVATDKTRLRLALACAVVVKRALDLSAISSGVPELPPGQGESTSPGMISEGAEDD